MKISRAAVVAAAALAALALASPAAAQTDGAPERVQLDPEVLAEHDGLSVAQAPCEAGGQITVTITGVTFYVSSGIRTAGLAAQLDGQVYAREQTPADNGAHTVDESVTVPAPAAAGVLQYRWFGGPERTDLPTWDLAGHPDWVDTVVDLEAAQGRPWDARDTGPFVTWYEVDVAGCAAPPSSTPTPGPTAGPDPSASPAPGAAGGLPVTGASVGIYAVAGVSLLAAGIFALVVLRRRRPEFAAGDDG